MTRPARRLGLMLLCLAGFLAGVAALNWLVNPYGAWRTTVIDPAYRLTAPAEEEADERVTTAYRIRAARPTSVLIGSSRVLNGMPLEDGGPGSDFFNASMSGASLAEIQALLRLATANPHLRRVVWGVEFYAFDERLVGFRHPETRIRLEGDEWDLLGLRITETLLSRQALHDSEAVLLRAVAGQNRPRRRVPVPWPAELIRERLERRTGEPGLDRADETSRQAQLSNWISSYVGYRLSEGQLALFQETVARTKAAGIALTLFVPPLSRCELEAIDQAGAWETFQHWKRQLLAAGPYWDLSGYGKLDQDDSLFLDVPHFKPVVGQVILRELLDGGCPQCGKRAQAIHDAADWLDGSAVDAALARQAANRVASRRKDRCARLVREILRARGVVSD